ncbi:MAG: FISUMP domain-containing protein [Ignavibacteriaceae bacterium]|jgi:uncharacterized protein (TIGR02145 family)
MKKSIYFLLISLLVFTSCKKDASNPVNADTVPAPPTLASPTDTSSNIVVPVVLTWKESSGAKNYTLQVSASSSFSSFVFNKSDITTTTQQVPDLNYLAVYYWRVSATNSAGTSDWSKVWSFNTTKDEPALIPQLSLPANGAVNQKFAPVLTWNKINNAIRYAVQLSTNSSFTNFVFDEDSLTTTTKQINDLSGSTTYYWRVSAANNFGTKGWSETWSFTTGVALVPPILLTPADGTTDISLSPTFTWNGRSGATSYTLQVSTNSSFTNYVFNQYSTTTNKQITGLTNSTKYFWRVAATNIYGTSTPSDVWSFTTGAPPTPPTLLTPTDGATDVAVSPTLTWNASNGATSYTLQVSTDNSFGNLVYNNSVGNTTSKQISGLYGATKYYWRVTVASNFGTSNTSDIWSFTTGAPPTPPTLLTPTDGATDVAVSPTLTWNASNGATSYTLQVTTDNSFGNLVYNNSVGNITSKQISGLYGLTKHYWRVTALNSFGSSIWSESRSFFTQDACGDAKTVLYGNRTYNLVSIGGQCWFKENLEGGKFYTWDEAMANSTTSGAKGICPDGWHIPKQDEFRNLVTAVNQDGNSLKAIGQGTGSGTGTNTSGFSALLSGYIYLNIDTYNVGIQAYFWSSTEHTINFMVTAHYFYLESNDSHVNSYNYSDYNDRRNGFNVRCLKNN